MGLRLSLEFMKLKRRFIVLPLVLIIAVGLGWTQVITMTKLTGEQLVLSKFFDLATINSLILPLFICVLSARVMELEHMGKTFKLLQSSNETPEQLFGAKVVLMMLFLIPVSTLQVGYLVLFAQEHGSLLSFGLLAKFVFSFLFIGLALSMLHLFLAFAFPKQTVTITAGLIGSFISLVTGGMLPGMVQAFIPWQYYEWISPITRNRVGDGFIFELDSCYVQKIGILIFIISLAWLAIQSWFRKVDLL
ncbi:ABC transporter permease [Streptococcus caprae]|uniref:ABC transporter permease n=1 Tax=Streptococcus caprae TaxID=1640501 RepID=A0ABV8CY22_9STRE